LVLIVAFGLVLMAAVLVSERANRTVLSSSVIFLGAGFGLGRGGLGWVQLGLDEPVIGRFAELSLFAILFVDGAKLPVAELRRAWKLPGRALLLGMPLTVMALSAAGHWVLGMTWSEAFLVGAILSPTDPVFVTAILEHEGVPARLQRLLGIESGLNDGVALPLVMVLLEVASQDELHPWKLLFEAGLGVLLGLAAPVGFSWLERRRPFAAAEAYEPLAGVAIAATCFGASKLLQGNVFLAAYVSGVVLASLRPPFARAVQPFGAPLAEALKLATLLIFGAVLTAHFLFATGWAGILFAVTALLAARPLALVLALLGGGLSCREWLAAAWFGPKGFASLLYALLLLGAGLPRATWLFQAAALVIVASIVAHSSTDVAVARTFRTRERATNRRLPGPPVGTPAEVVREDV
jgi:sodium/hydrogen antiporter